MSKFEECHERELRHNEEIGRIGEKCHFNIELADGKFFLKRPCHHIRSNGEKHTHEFGVYKSKSNEIVFFHVCDICCYIMRITEDDYHTAEWEYKDSLERIGEIGEPIVFQLESVISNSKCTFFEECNYHNFQHVHEYGMFLSRSGEEVYFRHCLFLPETIRISWEDYNKAMEKNWEATIDNC